MNVEFVNPFLGALIEVLETMAKVTAERGPLSIKPDKRALGVVTGIIDLKGNLATGSLAISFSAPAILAIFRNMVGEERDAVDDEVADLVGELTNMVTGGAKRVFAEKGYEFDMATPALLKGEEVEVDHKLAGKTVVVPFSSEVGEFFVEVCFAD